MSSPVFQSVCAQLSLIDGDPAQINFPPALKHTRAFSYTHAGTVCSHVDIGNGQTLHIELLYAHRVIKNKYTPVHTTTFTS